MNAPAMKGAANIHGPVPAASARRFATLTAFQMPHVGSAVEQEGTPEKCEGAAKEIPENLVKGGCYARQDAPPLARSAVNGAVAVNLLKFDAAGLLAGASTMKKAIRRMPRMTRRTPLEEMWGSDAIRFQAKADRWVASLISSRRTSALSGGAWRRPLKRSVRRPISPSVAD